MMSIDVNSIAILDIHGVDYSCITFGIRKSETIHLLKKADLSKKVDLCKI